MPPTQAQIPANLTRNLASQNRLKFTLSSLPAEARGELLVGPGTEVYAGMIVGIYNRQEDIEINVCKAKHLTNMRSKSSDGTVQLTPFTQFSLEQCIDFIEDDELLEVTPKSLRLRKRYLDANERKRANKK